ncbi:MAG: long-chain fatty acid--CoA ligase [Alphaproteobacteria bacterium]|nr:long-chain fatty acid--CoA ligase [Alphaproteobacteria bacterium]
MAEPTLRYGVNGTSNLPGSFFEAASQDPDKTLLVAKKSGEWTPMTFKETEDQVRRLAGVLLGLGVKPGDKVFVSAENRPEWAVADLAIMAIGAIVVPAFVTNTEDDFYYIMSHSEAVVGITSGGSLADSVSRAASQCSGLKTMIVMDGETKSRSSKSLKVLDWSEELAKVDGPADLDDRVAGLDADDVCCFIYTSGTGGRPKGVMLTHKSIQANITAAIDLLKEGDVAEDQRFLSLLPLSHSYEHTAGMHLPFQTRSEVWYCESADQIANNLAEVSPTLMTAVPRLYEVLHDRITRGVKAKGGVSEKLFNAAVRIGIKRMNGERLSVGEALINPLLDKLVRKKVKMRLGGRLQFFISGGAALNPEIGGFFMGLGVNILQGYGQTEASPLISANRPGSIKIETVGPAVQGVEVKLTDETEIIVRGDLLMKGYWKDKAATDETIVNGWLHTGDLGSIDDNGFITITGRKKDIIVNSGGDNIAPSRVEGILTMEPEIEQAMVDGDKKPWLAAVIVPSPSLVDNAADAKAVQKAVAEAVERANHRLSKLEQVRRFLIADEAFTVDNAQMTATLKARRHVIREVYGERIDALYPKKS